MWVIHSQLVDGSEVEHLPLFRRKVQAVRRAAEITRNYVHCRRSFVRPFQGTQTEQQHRKKYQRIPRGLPYPLDPAELRAVLDWQRQEFPQWFWRPF